MTSEPTVQDSARRAHGRNEWRPALDAGAGRRPIWALAETVAAQIAAGEVIERPAAVLKELLENAVDASARRVTVEIGQAGRERICVHDGGAGISRVELACMRHAASKLSRAVELDVDGSTPLEAISALYGRRDEARSQTAEAGL